MARIHSQRLLDHFQNPRNVGDLEAPAVTVEVENPACGDVLRLSVQWEEGRIGKVRFRARGCAASVAAGSALTGLLEGRTRQEAEKVDAAAVEEAVGGLIPESKHAAALCADAVRALLRAGTPE